MTQEELIKEVSSSNIGYYREHMLKKFFSEHVCIKKGTNRHPDADAIHHLAEGTAIVEVRLNYDPCVWAIETYDMVSYRIKAQEPVYEWKWQYPSCDFKAITEYMTEEEADKTGIQFWKIEETKRERKQ